MFDRLKRSVADGAGALAKAGYSLRFPGVGGGGYNAGSPTLGSSILQLMGWGLPGSAEDYRRRAGNLWDNGIVASVIAWVSRTAIEAQPVVQRRDANQQWEILTDHAGQTILDQPNPWYEYSFLMGGILLSLIVDGNAYLLKLRSAAGNVVGLLYIPHIQIEPRFPMNGSEWVASYAYWVDGKPQPPIPATEIVHLKGWMSDPLNWRKALSPLKSQMREIVTDNECSTYSAALMRNMGIPGVVISPKTGSKVSPEQGASLKQLWRESTTGEKRGEPVLSSLPVDIEFMGFSPEALALDTLRRWPVDRVCAAIGVDPMVLGLPSESKTYNNLPEARDGAYESCIIPLHRLIDSQLTRQVMGEVIGAKPGDRFARDYSDVRCLQPDYDKMYNRLTTAVGGPWITPNEARRIANQPVRPDGDRLYPSRAEAGMQNLRRQNGDDASADS